MLERAQVILFILEINKLTLSFSARERIRRK